MALRFGIDFSQTLYFLFKVHRAQVIFFFLARSLPSPMFLKRRKRKLNLCLQARFGTKVMIGRLNKQGKVRKKVLSIKC